VTSPLATRRSGPSGRGAGAGLAQACDHLISHGPRILEYLVLQDPGSVPGDPFTAAGQQQRPDRMPSER